MNNLANAHLELPQLQAIVRAMYEVAITDGVNDAESVMLRGFYDACQQEAKALTSYDDLIKSTFDLHTIGDTFTTAEQKGALLHSCLLLAHTDGNYSSAERAKIGTIATALGVSAAELGQLEDAVSDTLLQQISRITNVDALREVAGKMSEK
jgi:tellurite resistance protein